jgi:queuine tRNA-ribosyltransferase
VSHEVVRTRRGDLAIRCREVGEVMHPGVGPLAEARQLYVGQSRLAERLRAAQSGNQDGRHEETPLVLFDVGLGAGSNALAAWEESARAPATARPLEMVSFERDLGALHLGLSLPADDAGALGFTPASAAAARALLAAGEHRSARTCWRLRPGELLPALAAEPSAADIVFWDPFSPRANPELWTVAAFAAVRARAGARCTLFTYSASTATRVAMLLAGWVVGVGDPVGDKAETTAAAVDGRDLARPLGPRFLERLGRSQAPLPADAPVDARARIAAAPQFAPSSG